MSAKDIEAVYPLSPAQQGILFHALYAPESRAYFSQLSCTIHDDLNTEVFERAWQQTMNRHGVLRTAFAWEELDEPLQVVGRNVKLRVTQLDWRELSAAQQQERLTALLQEDRTRGFKLSKAPLMRLSIVRLSEHAHQFIWSFHHLLLDGWSQSLIIKEVFALYEAYVQGKEIKLPLPRYSHAEVMERYAAEGVQHLLICPIGFVCEHVEILYDIDIVYQRLAQKLGVHLERIEMLNDSPEMIRGLAGLVRQTVQEASWQ